MHLGVRIAPLRRVLVVWTVISVGRWSDICGARMNDAGLVIAVVIRRMHRVAVDDVMVLPADHMAVTVANNVIVVIDVVAAVVVLSICVLSNPSDGDSYQSY